MEGSGGDRSIQLNVGGSEIMDSLGVANEFNKCFLTIENTTVENLAPEPDFERYMTNIESHYLVFTPISLTEVKSVVDNMKETAVGHDGWPIFIFKNCFSISFV